MARKKYFVEELVIAVVAEGLVIMVNIISRREKSVAIVAGETLLVIQLTQSIQTLSEHHDLAALHTLWSVGLCVDEALAALGGGGGDGKTTRNDVGTREGGHTSTHSAQGQDTLADLLEVLELEEVVDEKEIGLRNTERALTSNECSDILTKEESAAGSDLRRDSRTRGERRSTWGTVLGLMAFRRLQRMVPSFRASPNSASSLGNSMWRTCSIHSLAVYPKENEKDKKLGSIHHKCHLCRQSCIVQAWGHLRKREIERIGREITI